MIITRILNMTFKGILDQVGTWGALHGLPVFFGDESTRNRLANEITGDFIFVDVPGGRQDYNDYAAEPFAITVLIQVLGTSFYERDDAAEIDVLDRTFTAITDIANKAVCLYVSSGAAIVKRQNIYDSPKSGWEITLNLSE